MRKYKFVNFISIYPSFKISKLILFVIYLLYNVPNQPTDLVHYYLAVIDKYNPKNKFFYRLKQTIITRSRKAEKE